MQTAPSLSEVVAPIFKRLKSADLREVARDQANAQRCDLGPIERYRPRTEAELLAKAEAEAAAKVAFQASPAGQFVASLNHAETALQGATAALSALRSARSRADGQINAGVLAKLAEFKAAAAAIQAEAILLGVFAAQAQAVSA